MAVRTFELGDQYRGQTIEFHYDNPIDDDGEPLVLADWTWRLTVKTLITDADPGIGQIYSPSSGITFPTSTRVLFRMPSSTTAAFTLGTKYWDLWLTYTTDTSLSRPILKGTFLVLEGVTDTHP
jgi:hypothetical protein